MARVKRTKSAVPSQTLDALLEDVNPQRATQERKFQAILDAYNGRSENKEEGLSGVKFYIFRTFPRIDNRLSGRQHSNIETFEAVKASTNSGEMLEVSELPADIRAYVTQRHGGGRYRVSLNDKNREQEQVVQTALKVDEIEYPPILDPKELVGSDPETLGWITRQVSLGTLAKLPSGEYTMANGTRPAQANSSEDSAGMSAVAIEAMRLAQKDNGVQEHAYKAAIDMVKENVPAAMDPVATFTAMAAVLKGNGGGDSTTAMMGLLSTMIVENNKMMMFMMQQKNPQPRGGGDDEGVDKVERIMDIVAKYGGPKASGGGIMDMLKEWAPMILPLFLMGKMPPGQAAQVVQSLANKPGDTPAADPGANMPAPGAGGQLTMQQAEDFAARAANAMQRGHTGDDFAQGLEIMFRPETYDMVAKLGRDNIVAFLLQSQAGQFFQTNGPATTKFIEDFVKYGEPEAPPPPGTPLATAPAEAPASA